MNHILIGFTLLLFCALVPEATAQASARLSKKAYAVYAPKPDYPFVARSHRLTGHGIFVVNVRDDGTVESVDVAKSTGHSELDRSGIAAFLKWRFRPGTVKKAKIPVTFSMRGLPEKASPTSLRLW
jgi:TonB family protein